MFEPDGPGPSIPGRLAEAGRRFAEWSATPFGFGILFVLGLAIRFALAGGGGFPFDMSSFAGWAGRLADRGPWNFYPPPAERFFVDYPPGYLYVLWMLGVAGRVAGKASPPVLWLKLPAILADLGLAYVIAKLATRLAPAGRRSPVRGIAATAILLNPAVIFISAVWGQADSVPALLVAGSFLLFATAEPSFRREAGGAVLLAAALATKPQTIFVVPAVVVVLSWRHLRLATDDRLRLAVVRGASRIAATAAVGATTAVVLLAPFRLWPLRAYEFYMKATGTYKVTSVFAFNLWGALAFWRDDSGRKAFEIAGVPALYVGLALFVAGAAIVCWRAYRALAEGQDEGRVLAFGGISITLVAFATLTRIHERYLFMAVVLMAAFVALRRFRWVIVALSALYLVNVFFPYVYYLRFVGRPAPGLGGAFDAFYGGIGGGRLKLLSALIGITSLFVAWRGWRWLELSTTAVEPGQTLAPPVRETEHVLSSGRLPWELRLYKVGRRGALLALAVFAVAFVSRVAGLGHPPGMYFDEVYHARTGGEYLAHKEVYEWTHPPLAKEIIASSMKGLSGFGASAPARSRGGIDPSLVASGPNGIAWAVASRSGTEMFRGGISEDCELTPRGSQHVDIRPDAVATTGDHVLLGGEGPDGAVLARFDGSRETWRASLPGAARQIAAVGDGAYVLTDEGTLVFVTSGGDTDGVAVGAAAIASSRDGLVWAAFPRSHEIVSWDGGGKRKAVVGVSGRPSELVVPDGSSRVVVADPSAGRFEVVDAEAARTQEQIAPGASLLGTVPETGLAWALHGRTVRVVEPRGASVIGRATLPFVARSVFADPARHRLVAASRDSLSCVGGRPAFAWRFGSAVMGSAMVALVFLIALRLFGSLPIAGAASLFMTVEGLAFAESRIAMNDSYVTAFILAAWFCALSALDRWGCDADRVARRSRAACICWLAAGGVFAGLGLASKWVGLYAIAGLAGLIFWDGLTRERNSIWTIAGGPIRSAILLAVSFGVVPLLIYVASYIPYFTLGHSAGAFLKLQADMYSYHAHLTSSHPFGSKWYLWPFARRAVFLYLADHGAHRSEIWTVPNLFVLWGGIAAMVVAGMRAVRTRSVALAIVVGAALVQYLPWATVTRVTFLYHFLPVVPFLAIALAWWLIEGLRGWPYQRYAVALFVAGSVLFFFAVLPMLEGWSMPVGYLESMRRVLPWIFNT